MTSLFIELLDMVLNAQKVMPLIVTYNVGKNCVDPDQLADLGLYYLIKRLYIFET